MSLVLRVAAEALLLSFVLTGIGQWTAPRIGAALACLAASLVISRHPRPRIREQAPLALYLGLCGFALAYALRPAPASARFGLAVLTLLFAGALVAFARPAAPGSRRLLGRLGLVLLSLAAALTVAETLAARRWPRNPHGIVAEDRGSDAAPYVPDARLGRRFQSGFRGRFTHPEYQGEPIAINSDGFRDREWSPVPPPAWPAPGGELRVLVLGDSTTVGFGVERERSIPALLEAELRVPEGTSGVRVINAGVPGYGARHEAILLDLVWERTRPCAVVVIFYDGNDLPDARDQLALEAQARGEDPPRAADAVTDEDPDPGSARTPTLLEWDYWSRASILWERLSIELGLRNTPAHAWGRRTLESMRRDPPPAVREELDWTIEALARIDTHCREHGTAFLLARLPARVQVEADLYARLLERYGAAPGEHDRTLPGRAVLERCRERGIATLDLLPALERPTRDGQATYFREGHPNALGDEIAAREIGSELSRMLLVHR